MSRCPPPLGAGLRLLTNTFREVWRARRSATSIFAASAGRAHRLFRLTPPGRFATFGGKCPGCSIIRTFLTVVLMVSLPRYGSLCHLRWQQPTGLALPSAPQGTRFPPSPPNEIRIQRHVRWIRKPCAARFPCTFPRPRRRRRGNMSWRKRSPQASFFDTLRLRRARGPSEPF